MKAYKQAIVLGLCAWLLSPAMALKAAEEPADTSRETQKRVYMQLDFLELLLDYSEAYESRCNMTRCSEQDYQALFEAVRQQHPAGALWMVTENALYPYQVKAMLGDAQYQRLTSSLANYASQLKQLRTQAFPNTSAVEKAWQNAENGLPTPPKVAAYSVKANMHTLQTMLETYAVDWGGLYPDSLAQLKHEATNSSYAYWKELTNPYTSETGLYNAILDYQAYRPLPQFKGMALYEPLPENGRVSTYRIWGTDEKAQILQDKNKDFILSNS